MLRFLQRDALLTLLFLTVAVLAMGVLLGWYLITPDPTTQSPARKAFTPESEQAVFTDLAGNKIEVSESIGSYILVYSWASWCPQCAEGLQDFDRLVGELRADSVELKAYAANRAEKNYVAQQFLDTQPDLNHAEVLLDAGDNLFESIDGYAMPEVVLFNPGGDIVYHGRGEFNSARIKKAFAAES